MLIQVEKEPSGYEAHKRQVAGYILILSLLPRVCTPCPCGDTAYCADTLFPSRAIRLLRRLWNCCKKSSAFSAWTAMYANTIWTCDRYMEEAENLRMAGFVDDLSAWGAELIAVLDDQAAYALMACRHPVGRMKYPLCSAV